MKTFVAGLSFKTAPVELREKLAVSPSRLRCNACKIKINGGLNEVVLLSTCNRVEVYGVTSDTRREMSTLLNCLAKSRTDVSQHVYVHEGEEAIQHLFSVAGGLDSMVIGETEITGQVKHAYHTAHESGLTGRITNCLFQKALQTAKVIRTRTQVGRGATSVGSVAVQLAEKIFDTSFADKTVMILGAGKMGEACVRHLAKKGLRSVIVANRSIERAEELAKEFGGAAVRLDDCKKAMVETDIVVSSTGSPHLVLMRKDVEEVMAQRRNRPLFLIDIAVPRDIDPSIQGMNNVYLYDIDDLQGIVRENARLREQEVSACAGIIAEKTTELFSKFNADKKYEPRRSMRPAWGLGEFAPSAA